MSRADGTVIGITKIADAGPPSRCWNLVIVSDGYRGADMARFADDANAIRDRLLQEPPFNRPEIASAINIYRLDVTSTDSGADKPRCADGAGNGSTAKTYFDSTFCSDGRTERLLYGDTRLAQEVVGHYLPEWHQILVLVDDHERGGAGGQVGWFSNGGSDWREVAIHELGHSAFGLADEYDYGGPDHWSGSEPSEPNVTRVPDPRQVKWRTMVTAGSGVPTRANPNCGDTDHGPAPQPPHLVGTFEGAKYAHCGAYRSTWNCMMRDTSAPFCPVCTATIARVMAPFATAAP